MIKLELQWLVSSTSLPEASDLTSASLSPNRLTYIGTILESTNAWKQNLAMKAPDSAAANLSLHDCLLAEAAFSAGKIYACTLSLSNRSASGIALDRAYTLTESLLSSKSNSRWVRRNSDTCSVATLSESTDKAWEAPLRTIGVSSFTSFPNFLRTMA